MPREGFCRKNAAAGWDAVVLFRGCGLCEHRVPGCDPGVEAAAEVWAS